MKKIHENENGLFCWREGVTVSREFEKDSEQYQSLIDEGCEVVLLDQSVKDAMAKQSAYQDAKASLLASLNAIAYDIGGGKFIQARPQDENYLRGGIAGGVATRWKLADNTPHTVTVEQLQAALDYGKVQVKVIWDNHLDTIEKLT